MKKLIKNIHRGKWSLVLIPVIMISLISLALFGYRKIFASMTYKLITDSNGITWQYGFDPSNNTLEVSFFDTTNSITQITIPDKSYFINNDASISSVSKYIFTSYANHNLGTPATFTSAITKMDLSKANEVNGVAPLLQTSSVTEVVLNTTASKIGNDVFRNAKLNAKNMNKITNIGHGAFYNVTFSTTTISMPNLNTLGNGSFEGSNITTVELNSPVIGVSAFKDCTSLKTATFKDNVNELSAGAFMGDTALSSVTFNKVKIIGSEAFKNCTSFNQDLKDTKIESIGAEAFAGTTGYNLSIKLPNGVETLPYKVFFGSNIESIDINNVYWIGTQAFEDCHLDEIDLKQVERIDYRAFANNNIEEIYFPKSIVYMMDSDILINNPTNKITIAFDTLSNKISSLWVTIDSYYSHARPTKEIELVAPYANGEKAILPQSHFEVTRLLYTENYSNHYYVYTSEYDDKENIKSNEVKMAYSYRNVVQANYLFNLKEVTDITIGEGYEFLAVRSMSSYYSGSIGYPSWIATNDTTDYSVYKLKNVSLPSTLKGIGANAFNAVLMGNDVNINLPESLEYIGPGAFFCCRSIKIDVDLPNLKYIGNCAFYGAGITSIVYHDKLEYIGQRNAYYCMNLSKIIIDCDYFSLVTPNFPINDSYYGDCRHDNIINDFFYVNYNDERHYYIDREPFELIKFTEKVVTKPRLIQGNYFSVTCNYNSMFRKIKAKTIDLEDVTWTVMPGEDFKEVDIETLKLPKNLITINMSSFYCARVKNLELPDSVKIIRQSAFVGSYIILDKLPSSLESIEEAAFYDSILNDNIVIPSSVRTIGHSAFGTCPLDWNKCVDYYAESRPVIERNSITFNNNIGKANNDTIGQMLVNTKVNEIIIGEETHEMVSSIKNGNSLPSDVQYSEFVNLNVGKVTAKGLNILSAKAFINNPYIKIVDLSEDANLSEIQGYAFYYAPNLEKVILPSGKEIIIGEHAFHGSGLESIGDETSGLDVKNTDVILNGECTFQAMPDLVNINLTEHFNEGVIPNGTFADNVALKKVELQSGVTTIEPYAFYHDSVIDSFVMYGDTEIKDLNYIELRSVSSISFNINTNSEEDDFSIVINDSVKGKTTITKFNFSNNRYTYSAGDNAVVRISCSDNISFYKLYNTITIYDRNKMPTIPATSNLYCYSTNELCQNHYDTYKTEHDNEDTKLYYLDEVIYMDSNGAPVELNEDNTELVTDDLVLYALRRDGVVLVSKKWKQKTGATKLTDSGITIRDYNSTTEDPSLMIFNNRAAIDSIDTDTNDNFENIEYVVGDVDPNTERVSISLVYNNIVSEVTADTTLRTQGNAADVTYSDGCGGEAFANVIFRDVAIGSETPSFGENPTREGYDFLGWDKEVSETVAGDVIYTARWNRVGDPIPEPPEPYNPWSNIVNPQTGILLIILLPIIVLILGSINIYLKKKREA